MSADHFRLILSLCAVALTVAIMGALNPFALFIAIVGGILWLAMRVILWGWRRWGR